MPIPARLQPKAPADELVRAMGRLCSRIEHAIDSEDDTTSLLAQWHVHSTRPCSPADFKAYSGAMEKDDFVREALFPRPAFVDDLQYGEARAVVEAISNAELRPALHSYFLNWLDMQFPNGNISNLIYWPDAWFGNPSLFRDAKGAFKRDAELSIDQILAYVMKKSSRLLPGAPADVRLPFPMPAK